MSKQKIDWDDFRLDIIDGGIDALKKYHKGKKLDKEPILAAMFMVLHDIRQCLAGLEYNTDHDLDDHFNKLDAINEAMQAIKSEVELLNDRARVYMAEDGVSPTGEIEEKLDRVNEHLSEIESLLESADCHLGTLEDRSEPTDTNK